MIMALQVFTDLMALLWQHPLLSGLALLLFTPPFFPIVKFFSPLLISTALFMLALFTMGGPETTSSTSTTEDNWEFRRAADVKVWEDKSVSRRLRKGDGSWMEYVQTLAESTYAWIETKLQNENWKASAVNDDNVSILQEASWPTTRNDDAEPLPTEDINVPAVISPSILFKVDSKLKVLELGEDVLKHEPLSTLEIPNKTVPDQVIDNSPSTDVEDSDRIILSTVRRDSMNASSGLSDDSPVALSKSGKLKQIEMLGELIEEKEQHRGEVPSVLKATIAEQVEAVKEKLEGFTHSPEHENHPGSPLFKQGKKEKEGTKGVVLKKEKEGTKDVALKKSRSSFSDDSSSGVEMLSDSDSEFEIFPPVDPAKMKLHPPVKLDILELEKKLGTSLSQRTKVPKGEITEVH